MHKKTYKIIIWLTLISVIYAIIRYHGFKGVPIAYFIDVFNKGIALAAILLIALSLSIGPLGRRFPKKFGQLDRGKRLFGIWGFILSFFHTLLSLLYFQPNHYAKFFSFLKINALGEYILMTGFISLILVGAAFITSFPLIYPFTRKTFFLSQFAGYIGCIFAGLHVFPIGINHWFSISSWPGYMMPITFISFISVIITVLFRTFSTFLTSYQKGNS